MPRDKDCCGSFRDWLGTPSCVIYSNYFLSAWGDWMWQFAAGLYLVYLAEDTLRLAAIFGFTGGSLILLLGGVIGNWVDNNGRLKVVRITLFVQNLSVSLCATTVCLVLYYHDQVKEMLDGRLKPLCEAIIIGFALVAYLASMAYKISIEKDWIVVVASGDSGKLTNLNAVTRAIDLSCKILAPTVAGLIMTYGSLIVAAIFIAVWNVVSVFIEYALLWKVYQMVPELAIKNMDDDEDEVESLEENNKTEPGSAEEKQQMMTDKDREAADVGADDPDVATTGSDKNKPTGNGTVKTVVAEAEEKKKKDDEDKSNGKAKANTEVDEQRRLVENQDNKEDVAIVVPSDGVVLSNGDEGGSDKKGTKTGKKKKVPTATLR